MSLGWKNPLPLQLGGASTRTEQVYGALRSAQGLGNDGKSAAGPEDGLRDLWTQCVATAIARRGGTTERAVLQFWPATMTSSLATWETLLGISPARSLPERQRAVQAAIAKKLDATIPGLRSALQAIDPSLDVLLVPFAQARVTEPGRSFSGLPGTGAPPFFGTGPFTTAGRMATGYPAFSDGHEVLVIYTSTMAQPLPTQSTIQAVTHLMNDTLPAYVAFDLGTISPGSGGSGPSGAGFFCDGANSSHLDFTRIF